MEPYNKSLSVTSKDLIYDAKYILNMLGNGFVSFNSVRKGGLSKILEREVKIKDSYKVTCLRTRNKNIENISDIDCNVLNKNYNFRSKYNENDQYFTSKIIQKDLIKKEVEVYNIKVDEDESYVTEHFVAHNCSFNASGDTFIFHEDILKIERQCKDANEAYSDDRNVWIWQKAERAGVYLISCDVSRGDSADYSAFHVLRLDSSPIEQVAEYKGKIRPDQLGYLLVAVAKMYNNATIAPENNSGWSGQTILKIEESQYPHLYYSRRRKPKEKDSSPVDPYYAMNRNDYLPGYSVTSANRLQMLAKLEQYLRMGDIKINSLRLINEIKTFVVREGNRPEALRGYNDDLIMALAGGLWVREEAYMSTYRSDEVAKALISAMSVSTNKTNNIPGMNASTNSGFYQRGQVAEHIENQHKIVLGDGSTEDISWLIR